MRNHKQFACCLLLPLSLMCLAMPAAAQGKTAAQESAQAEVEASIGIAFATAKAIAGNVDAFAVAAQPYGPLDLVVAKSPDAKYTIQLRHFFYGAVAAFADVSQERAIALLDEFHCGPPCAEARSEQLSKHLEAIRAIASQFAALAGVEVVATWPGADFRVGDLVHVAGDYVVMSPSPQLGLWPWESRPEKDPETLLKGMKTDRESLARLVETMRKSGIVALVKGDGGTVRAVMAGSIGPNEAGLIFAKSKKLLPKINVPSLDGRVVVAIRELSTGLYFYVST